MGITRYTVNKCKCDLLVPHCEAFLKSMDYCTRTVESDSTTSTDEMSLAEL